MRQDLSLDSEPWYRQFWPWFLIALPASVVVAGLTTVYIAFKGADHLAINQRLEQDQKALKMGLAADIRLDTESGELFVVIKGAEINASQLFLQLLHPTDEARDRDYVLSLMAPNQYRVDLEVSLNHRYYLRLLPEPDQEWRLNGEINFTDTNQVTLRTQ